MTNVSRRERLTNRLTNRKSEVRGPKSEQNPKPEARGTACEPSWPLTPPSPTPSPRLRRAGRGEGEKLGALWWCWMPASVRTAVAVRAATPWDWRPNHRTRPKKFGDLWTFKHATDGYPLLGASGQGEGSSQVRNACSHPQV